MHRSTPCLLTILLLACIMTACRQPGRELAVDQTPEVELDLATGVPLIAASEAPLYLARAATVWRDSVYLIEGSTNRVLVFGPEGRLEREFGGTGEGPGEFGYPRGLAVRDDSLVVWDSGLRKVELFALTPNGGSRVIVPRDAGGEMQGVPLGVLADGRIVVSEVVRPSYEEATQPVARSILRLSAFVPAESQFVALADVRAPERFQMQVRDGGSLVMGRLFGVRGNVEVGGELVAVLGQDSTGVLIRDLTTGGRVVATDPLNVRRVVSDAEWTTVVESKGASGELPEALDAMPRPDSMPYWGWEGSAFVWPIAIDMQERVWALRYGTPADPSQVWTVFSRDGSVVGRVRIPGEANILGFGLKDIVVQRWDVDGVEEVLRVPLPPTLTEP